MRGSQAYGSVGGETEDLRPFNRTIARVTEPRRSGGVVLRAATMGPMMQRSQGLLGSSLSRLDAFATGIDLFSPARILPRGGLKFGYTTPHGPRCSHAKDRARSQIAQIWINIRQFKRLMIAAPRVQGARQSDLVRFKLDCPSRGLEG
jgi:hypothetical protein